MPKVSVLIPSIRLEYLSQAIASTLAQTFTDFECLVADNTDDGALAPLVASYGDRRIRYLRTGGLSQAENLAFVWKASSAPLIKYLFDDDFMLPFCLAVMVQAMDKQPSATFAFVQRHFVSPNGGLLKSPAVLKNSGASVLDAGTVIPPLVGRRNNFIGEPSNVLFDRTKVPEPESMTHYRGFRLRFMFDVALYLNALTLGPCVGIGQFHAAFRQHAGQFSTMTVNPAFVAGLYEWELFIRGEVAAGRLPSPAALTGLEMITGDYGRFVDRAPELGIFLEGLPTLKARLQQGDTAVLDDSYRDAWRQVDAAIEKRVEARRLERTRAVTEG
ncbi:MAG: glycosyltransferase [Proteobacteria bacterium]|nr:glycosyltransferase [Pseudomonadota bacterium]